MNERTTPGAPALRSGMLLAFSLPGLMHGFMHGPEGQIQGVYAKHAGLSLAALAGAILLTRIFDAVTYPLIGYWSDRSFRNSGSRKTWIMAGTLLSVIGMWFLYRPPADVTITYFGIWTAVTYIGWKVTEIPYAAWSYGLSHDYVERARIQIWRTVAMLIGNLLFFTTPYLATWLRLSKTSEMNLEALSLTAMICAAGVPLVSLYAIRRVPDGEAIPTADQKSRYGAVEMFRSILRNGPMLRLMAAFVPVGLLSGMSVGVMYFFIDTYLGLSQQYSALMLLGAPASLLGVPLWGWLCMRYERHRVWAISLITAAVSYACMGFTPIGEAGLPLLRVLYPLTTFCLVGLVAVPAMIGDIVDYARLQTGEELAGIYSAVFTFVQKSLGGISASAGLAAIAWFQFDPQAVQQTASGVVGIKLIAVWLPALGLALASSIIWSFPLNRMRMAQINVELSARANK